MDIESFRDYCLSFGNTHDAFPFDKATSGYDRNLLVFYAGGKWFCFVNAVEFDRCTVKCAPERIAELSARYEGVTPGYHMNKKHWYTICLDGSVEPVELYQRLDLSYKLAKKK